MDQIKTLIAEGNIEEALQQLRTVAPAYESEILSLSGRLHKVNKDSRAGILSYQEENREHAKINYDTIALLTTITNHPEGIATDRTVTPSKPKSIKTAKTCPKCFLMYDFEDKEQVAKLKKFLHLFVRTKKIELFDMHEFEFGTDEAAEIEAHLADSDYVFCLITFMFLFTTHELAEKAKTLQKRIIPIHINVVDMEESFLKNLRMLPSNRKAVAEWKNEDAAYADIVSNLKKLF
ncbi:MAG: hypothetical protein AAF847_15715, partial [Bacteroidota bacterium]